MLARMYHDKNIVTVLFHRSLNKLSHIDVMKVHEYVPLVRCPHARTHAPAWPAT